MPEKKLFIFSTDRPTRFFDRPATRNKLFPKVAPINNSLLLRYHYLITLFDLYVMVQNMRKVIIISEIYADEFLILT